MKNIDSFTHVRGESEYIDDIPVRKGTLHAAVFGSPLAHGKIQKIDFKEALKMEGVVDIISAKDIPSRNQIGSIIEDEQLFADDIVHYKYQPIALVIAKTEGLARRALKKIKVEISSLPIIIDPRIAYKQKQLISASRTFQKGNSENA